jgi:hypothetical protein
MANTRIKIDDQAIFLGGSLGQLVTIDPTAGSRFKAKDLSAVGGPTTYPGVGVVNSTTETDILNKTISASALGANGHISGSFGVNFFNNTGGVRTLTLRVKLGGTTIFTDVDSRSSTANRRQAFFSFRIQNINAEDSQQCQITRAYNGASGYSSTLANVQEHETAINVATEDTSASVDLVVTGQLSAAEANLSFQSIATLIQGPFNHA